MRGDEGPAPRSAGSFHPFPFMGSGRPICLNTGSSLTPPLHTTPLTHRQQHSPDLLDTANGLVTW